MNQFLMNTLILFNMSYLTKQEKQMVEQMKQTTKSEYYYDNPSAAIDDIEYLLSIVRRLDDKLTDLTEEL